MISLVSKYWICNDCASARKLIHWKSGNTHRLGRCGYCEDADEKTLTPIIDLKPTPPGAEE